LRNCICDLLERPQTPAGFAYPRLRIKEFEFLLKIAALPPAFTRSSLDIIIFTFAADVGSYNRYNHPYITDFQSIYGVLYPYQNNPGRLCLDPRLRALLRDYIALLAAANAQGLNPPQAIP
jgi:hypothetical protein